jgi:dienelactone hydrolase
MIILIPGFMAAPLTMLLMKKRLQERGHYVELASIFWNVGQHDRHMSNLINQVVRSGTKVTLIGWSLGGLYARELAHRYPKLVKQVITLGSPIQIDTLLKTGKVSKPVLRCAEVLMGCNLATPSRKKMWLRTPPVPTVAIHSTRDGIVEGQYCKDIGEGKNIEVSTTHVFMGVAPKVFNVITRELL